MGYNIVALSFFFMFLDNLLRREEGQGWGRILAVLREIRGDRSLFCVESGHTLRSGRGLSAALIKNAPDNLVMRFCEILYARLS